MDLVRRSAVAVAVVVLAGTTAVGIARAHAAASFAGGLPRSWFVTSRGPDGGTVWQGRIPNGFAPWDHRASTIYLPPRYDAVRRYPVIYLLHGMAGNPFSFVDALHFAGVADRLIASGASSPFIAVMPVAGPMADPNGGEWAGVWEDFVIRDVVPWVDAHLATIRSPAGRALEGLCAGGYGAMDIGLRHPHMFGTLGAWDGYFAPVFADGPFVGASGADLAAHDPALLVRREVQTLRRDRIRFYVSVGGNHGDVLRVWSLRFAEELGTLGLPHELWLLPPRRRGHFWSATMPSALTYAGRGFPRL